MTFGSFWVCHYKQCCANHLLVNICQYLGLFFTFSFLYSKKKSRQLWIHQKKGKKKTNIALAVWPHDPGLSSIELHASFKKWKPTVFKACDNGVADDGIQDMLPPKRATWHTEVSSWRNLRNGMYGRHFLIFP